MPRCPLPQGSVQGWPGVQCSLRGERYGLDVVFHSVRYVSFIKKILTQFLFVSIILDVFYLNVHWLPPRLRISPLISIIVSSVAKVLASVSDCCCSSSPSRIPD